jgi:hypothetical protein
VLSVEGPSQLSDILAELRPINRTPSNIRFLEVCRQKERFTSIFIAKKGTSAFKLINTRSETIKGIIIKKGFNIRIERLYYKKKVPDIK